MKGTRPFNNTEIRLVSTWFDGVFKAHDHRFFMFGVSIGEKGQPVGWIERIALKREPCKDI